MVLIFLMFLLSASEVAVVYGKIGLDAFFLWYKLHGVINISCIMISLSYAKAWNWQMSRVQSQLIRTHAKHANLYITCVQRTSCTCIIYICVCVCVWYILRVIILYIFAWLTYLYLYVPHVLISWLYIWYQTCIKWYDVTYQFDIAFVYLSERGCAITQPD